MLAPPPPIKSGRCLVLPLKGGFVQCCVATTPHFWKICASFYGCCMLCVDKSNTQPAHLRMCHCTHLPCIWKVCAAFWMLHVSVDGRCHVSLCCNAVLEWKVLSCHLHLHPEGVMPMVQCKVASGSMGNGSKSCVAAITLLAHCHEMQDSTWSCWCWCSNILDINQPTVVRQQKTKTQLVCGGGVCNIVPPPPALPRHRVASRSCVAVTLLVLGTGWWQKKCDKKNQPRVRQHSQFFNWHGCCLEAVQLCIIGSCMSAVMLFVPCQPKLIKNGARSGNHKT